MPKNSLNLDVQPVIFELLEEKRDHADAKQQLIKMQEREIQLRAQLAPIEETRDELSKCATDISNCQQLLKTKKLHLKSKMKELQEVEGQVIELNTAIESLPPKDR